MPFFLIKRLPRKLEMNIYLAVKINSPEPQFIIEQLKSGAGTESFGSRRIFHRYFFLEKMVSDGSD